MEKIYFENTQSNIKNSTDKPKQEIILFLLNFSKALDVKQCKALGTVDYLLNWFIIFCFKNKAKRGQILLEALFLKVWIDKQISGINIF